MRPVRAAGLDRPLSAFVAATAVLAAALAGARNGPQRPSRALWYARLRKPALTPPGPLIGAAWTSLEALLVATGYRLLRRQASAERGVALGGWALTLACLAGYPWLFFGQRRLAASAGANLAMLASAATMAEASRRVDRPAAALSLPLLLWLGFASVLSEELWRRNPRLSRD